MPPWTIYYKQPCTIHKIMGYAVSYLCISNLDKHIFDKYDYLYSIERDMQDMKLLKHKLPNFEGYKMELTKGIIIVKCFTEDIQGVLHDLETL